MRLADTTGKQPGDAGRCRVLRGDKIGIGEPLFGGPERATVHLTPQDRKLVPYREIATAEALASMQPRNRLAWWVYFGDIPPDKIEPITIAQATAGLDIQISIAKDFETRARYVAMRDQLLQADDPSQPVRWNIQ